MLTTIEQVHRAVKLKLDKSDSLNYVSFLPEEIDFWLNEALMQTEKTRFTGNNNKRESVEQTQKRIDDLRTLVRESLILTTTAGTVKPNSVLAQLPSDYLFAMGEEVTIASLRKGYSILRYPGANSLTIGNIYLVGSTPVYNVTPYTINDVIPAGSVFVATSAFLAGGSVTLLYSQRVGIIETTTDRYSNDLDNPFGTHIFHNNSAKPLRLFRGNYAEIIGDGNYYIPQYSIRYIKKPVSYSYYTRKINSGEILPDVTYRIRSTDQNPANVIYNGVTYTGDTFFIGTNVTTFTKSSNTIIEQYSIADLAYHMHQEIVDLAVNLMIENIGDSERFQTNSIELNKME